MRLKLLTRSIVLAAAALLAAVAVQAQDSSSAEPADVAAAELAVVAAAPVPEPADLGVLRSLRVAGSVLRERTSTDGTAVNTSGGCIYNSSGSSFGVLNTPVFLPNGATVDTLRMYYFDTSGSDSMGWFTIYDLYGEIVQEFSVSSTGTLGNSFNDSAPINHVIDHSLYSYVLNWRPNVAGTTMQLCGFRIFYSN
jgi:hypothetical protein